MRLLVTDEASFTLRNERKARPVCLTSLFVFTLAFYFRQAEPLKSPSTKHVSTKDRQCFAKVALAKRTETLISDSQSKNLSYEDALESVIMSSRPSAKSELEVSRAQQAQLLPST